MSRYIKGIREKAGQELLLLLRHVVRKHGADLGVLGKLMGERRVDQFLPSRRPRLEAPFQTFDDAVVPDGCCLSPDTH